MRTPRQPSEASTRTAKTRHSPLPLGAEAGYRFGATAAFPEEALRQIVGADLFAVQEGKLQRRERFPPGHAPGISRPRKALLVVGHDLLGQFETLLIAPRRKAFLYEPFEGRTGHLRKLVDDVAHLVLPAALH